MSPELAAELESLQAETSAFDATALGHVFCMPDEFAQKVFARWARMLMADGSASIDQALANSPATHTPLEVDEDGIATIRVTGVMAKNGDQRWGVASTVEARRQIAQARHSKEIKGVLQYVESPGGTAAGTYELAEASADLAKVKPTWTQIVDVGASAGFWFGSQGEKVFANETALVGSIGTYSVVPDFSKFFESHGVTVHVFRAGKFKGMGSFGTEITDEQKEEFQRIVEGLNAPFVKGVAKARNIPIARVRDELADGRVHVARQALELGLIDGVQSWATTRSQFSRYVKSLSPTSAGRSKSAMSDTSAAPVAATFQELKQTFPHADAAFREKCLESGMTLDKARDAYAADLQSQLSAALQANEKLASENASLTQQLAEAKAAKSSRPGAPALADSGNPQPEQTGNAVEAWNAAIDANVKAGLTRKEAVLKANRDNPGLRERANAERTATA